MSTKTTQAMEGEMTAQTNLEENKRIVRAFIEAAFNQHQADRAADYLTSDVKWHGGTLGTVDGRENFVGLIGAIVSALPDLRNVEQDIIAERDIVSVRAVVEGTHKGDLPESPHRANTSGGMRSMCTAWRTEKSLRSGLRTTCLPSSTGLARTPLPGWRRSRRRGGEPAVLPRQGRLDRFKSPGEL